MYCLILGIRKPWADIMLTFQAISIQIIHNMQNFYKITAICAVLRCFSAILYFIILLKGVPFENNLYFCSIFVSESLMLTYKITTI